MKIEWSFECAMKSFGDLKVLKLKSLTKERNSFDCVTIFAFKAHKACKIIYHLLGKGAIYGSRIE